ncbi:hypothetical protein MTO96_008303 [Rhipicephalus appendiculatus]
MRCRKKGRRERAIRPLMRMRPVVSRSCRPRALEALAAYHAPENVGEMDGRKFGQLRLGRAGGQLLPKDHRKPAAPNLCRNDPLGCRLPS